jgi:sigma-B regulation protein RsbU (phosphoserine phosphatase)
MHEDGSYDLLDENDLVLGVSAQAVYRESCVQLHTSDRLILFTDGLTELENPLGQQYGVDRLIQFVRKNRNLAAADLKSAILNELMDFGKGIFDDDLTLLIIDVNKHKR